MMLCYEGATQLMAFIFWLSRLFLSFIFSHNFEILTARSILAQEWPLLVIPQICSWAALVGVEVLLARA
jgi:hypothetical protein